MTPRQFGAILSWLVHFIVIKFNNSFLIAKYYQKSNKQIQPIARCFAHQLTCLKLNWIQCQFLKHYEAGLWFVESQKSWRVDGTTVFNVYLKVVRADGRLRTTAIGRGGIEQTKLLVRQASISRSIAACAHSALHITILYPITRPYSGRLNA